MNKMEQRKKINKEANARLRDIDFGDKVTNICAGDKNPHRHSYFVRLKKREAECTDKNGNFWETSIEVIYPGHLSYGTCQVLFEPVWQANYGDE